MIPAAMAGTMRHEWAAGDQASFDTVIDRELIDRFADLSGDHNPLHMNEEYARRTPFGTRIAHGMIAGALFSRLIGEHLPGERALYRSQDLRFLSPLLPGTQVRVRGEVKSYDASLSLLTVKTTVTGIDGAPVFVEGTAEVVVRPPEEEVRAAGSPRQEHRGGSALEGRRAFVLGGSRGIGSAVCRELGLQGAAVAVGYRSDLSAAQGLCVELSGRGGSALPVCLDLGDGGSVAAAVREAAEGLGGLDILVLAGHGKIVARGIERGEWEDVSQTVARSAGALYHASRAALPFLKASGHGSIIAISSTVTREAPPPTWTAYTTAKTALVGLARSLAVELGPYTIRVNLVSPSLTEGEGTRGMPSRIREELAARSPLGRLARPEDVAAAVAFLASDAAGYLTGIDLPVCGGAVL